VRIIGFVFLLLISETASAQIKLTKLKERDIPKSMAYQGHIVHAVRWKDRQGEHVVITTETGVMKTKSIDENTYKDAELYAYHYLVKGKKHKLSWKVNDFITECPVDPVVNFVKKSLAVTDLNRDGIGEVWLMYKIACHTDSGPGDMKLVMYESGNKYSMRGKNKVEISTGRFMGGEYTLDPSFQTENSVFKSHAIELWNKNVLEKWK
jgi:hypothetical protein